MDISINTSINLFRNNIAEAIRLSQLPVGVVYYILKDVLNDVGEVYDKTLQKESEDIHKQIEEQEKEDVKEHQE